MPNPRIAFGDRSFASQLAAAIREARELIGWSQRELADRARTSHTTVWRIESARPVTLDLIVVERLLDALGISAALTLGGLHLEDRRRQTDGLHANANGFVGRWLGRLGFALAQETQIGEDRPRGWIDTLAFREADEALVVEETKTQIDDLGGIQRSVGFYEREAPRLAQRLGWRPRRIVVLLAVLDTEEVARNLRNSRAAVDAAFPVDPRATLDWLRDPGATPPRGWTLGVIDPGSRRHDWLYPSALLSRHRPPYADYRDAAARLLR
ncbi:MAG: helix-turn-helix transcriptional regulator [Chloroflexota bacterium]